jgi:uncharacterized phosphosugar-binding protein
MDARLEWRRQITTLVDAALERNDTALADVSAAIAKAIGSGRTVYAFGAGHSISLVNEMHRRAGSFKSLRPIWNTELTARGPGVNEDDLGRLESASGYYRELTDDLGWGSGDLCWVVSNSGRNPLVIELAQEAQRHEVAVIALTSVEHSTSVPAAPGLPRLLDIAEYVLDNCGRLGDAALDIDGVDEPLAATSTIIGSVLIHSAWAGAAELLAAAGHPPDVWASANQGPGNIEATRTRAAELRTSHLSSRPASVPDVEIVGRGLAAAIGRPHREPKGRPIGPRCPPFC